MASNQAITGFKRYTANLTQTTTGAPAATVFQNDLSAAIVWARSAAGIYTGTLVGAFVTAKTQIILGALNALATVARTSADVVTISTFDAAAVAADSVLAATPIEIRVWN